MDLMIDCCTEFIQLVTSEANEICATDNKATMNPEHIIKALQQLEFSEFEPELLQLLEQFKQENKGVQCCSLVLLATCSHSLVRKLLWCRCRQAKARTQKAKR